MKLVRVFLVLVFASALTNASFARAEPLRADTPLPEISNVRVVTAHAVAFEKFEIQFDVETVASSLYLPFDAQPPTGIPRAIGVTVDALFSRDAWKTTIIQPAFLYQMYEYSFRNNQDHFVPNGAPRWAARFAPQTAGAWEFRLRVVDRNGVTLSPAETFFVSQGGGERYGGVRESPYARNGFVRVSETDARYFEFQNGAPFHAQGYNVAFYALPNLEKSMRAWQLNGINFVRVWLSGASINGAAWSSWTSPGLATYAAPLASQETAPDSQFALHLYNERPCVFTDFHQEDVPVLPETKYHVTARVKLKNVAALPGKAGGFLMRVGGFADHCYRVQGVALNPPVTGTTEWITVEGDFTTRNNQYWLPYLWLNLDESRGEAFVDNVRVYRADDPARVNVLREPRADSAYEFDPMNSFKWDQFMQAAEQRGIFLKLVTDEKGEWIRNHLAQAGGITDKPGNYKFYAAPFTQVRWLHQAWWRYLIARWGYSTAIHSFEFINEGDPFLALHYDAADAMANYFHRNDPSHHLVTTSFWHSYPAAQFWANPKYPAVDYADLHAYILTGWGDNASFVPSENLETRADYVRSAPTSLNLDASQEFEQELTPRGLSLNDQGTWRVRYWIKGENVRAQCENGSGARVWWIFDDGLEAGKPQDNPTAQITDFECDSNLETFDWTQITHPIEIGAGAPREFHLFVGNSKGVRGGVWIDDLELVTPSGRVVPILGSFDGNSFTTDTAWYTAAYSELLGANSPVAARMPLIRAEGGINSKKFPNGLFELNQDREGVWLHNLIWGQINAGGMYELLWWGSEMIQDNPKTGRKGDLFWQYKTFQEFMWDIPLNNGNYRDANAETSDPNLRVWGQRDDVNGRAHLWIQNRAHTWDRVVNQQDVPAVSGIITLRGMKAGAYRVEWWETAPTKTPITHIETLTATDTLRLTLPAPLKTDVAVQVTLIQE